MMQAVASAQTDYQSYFVEKIVCAGLVLAELYVNDSLSLLTKVGIAAAGALVLSADTWRPYARLQWHGFIGLERWKTHLNDFTSNKEVKDLAAVQQKYSDFENGRFETGNKRWDSAEKYRELVAESATKLINSIFFQHVAKRAKILEIGSNVLNSQGLSHFARLLPKEHRINLTYSDYIQKVVEEGSVKTYKKYRCIDIRNPSTELAETQDCLGAINVADVIGYEDLSKMAKGACKLLKPNGTAILLADRCLEQHAIFDRFSNPDQFVFPWVVPCLAGTKLEKGLKVIAVDTLRSILEKWGDEYRAFFERLIELTPLQRRYFFISSFYSDTKLCEFLELLTENSCTSYDYTAFYEESVIAAFESNGFATVHSGFMEEPAYVNCAEPYNTIIYDPRNGGPCVCTKTAGVPKGNLKVISVFHALIFKKKKSEEIENHIQNQMT